MIFVTVGTQLPFPRLVRALDAIAGRHGLEVEGQLGDTGETPSHIKAHARLSPADFAAAMERCSVVVGHAGIGLMIAAAQHRRPLILMPRRAALGEHRNDHQLATARRFADTPGILIAEDEDALERLILSGPHPAVNDTAGERRSALIAALAAEIRPGHLRSAIAGGAAVSLQIPDLAVPATPVPSKPDVEFVGLRFDQLDTEAVVDAVAAREPTDGFAYVVTPNVDHVVRLRAGSDQPGLQEAYRGAALCLCDSRVLSGLARLRGVRLTVAPGSDITERLLRRGLPEGGRILLIGGDPNTVPRLTARFPGLQIVQHIPPMGLLRNPDAMTACVDRVIAESARLTLLAVGSPQQERIAYGVQQRGGATGTALCIGASIDFLTGAAARAPMWMRRLSLEWLHRLLSNPRRLWRRYLLRGPRIVPIIFRRS